MPQHKISVTIYKNDNVKVLFVTSNDGESHIYEKIIFFFF